MASAIDDNVEDGTVSWWNLDPPQPHPPSDYPSYCYWPSWQWGAYYGNIINDPIETVSWLEHDSLRTWAGRMPRPPAFESSERKEMTDELIERLNHLMALEQVMNGVRKDIQKARATLSPIRLLPREILSSIFLETVRGDSPLNHSILLVCQSWREIALNTPLFWSNIMLRAPPYQSSPKSITVAIKELSRMLSLSKAAPVSIHLTDRIFQSSNLSKSDLTTIFKTLSPHLSRVVELSETSHAGPFFGAILSRPNVDFSNLQRLSIDGGGYSGWSRGRASPFNMMGKVRNKRQKITLPNLVSAKLSNYRWDTLPKLICPKATSLSILSCSGNLETMPGRSVEHMPSLTTIQLDHVSIIGSHSGYSDEEGEDILTSFTWRQDKLKNLSMMGTLGLLHPLIRGSGNTIHTLSLELPYVLHPTTIELSPPPMGSLPSCTTLVLRGHPDRLWATEGYGAAGFSGFADEAELDAWSRRWMETCPNLERLRFENEPTYSNHWQQRSGWHSPSSVTGAGGGAGVGGSRGAGGHHKNANCRPGVVASFMRILEEEETVGAGLKSLFLSFQCLETNGLLKFAKTRLRSTPTPTDTSAPEDNLVASKFSLDLVGCILIPEDVPKTYLHQNFQTVSDVFNSFDVFQEYVEKLDSNDIPIRVFW